MKEIEVREVIVSRLSRRGNGTKYSPIREVLEIFEKDGTLISEKDGMDVFTQEQLLQFGTHLLAKSGVDHSKDDILELFISWCSK